MEAKAERIQKQTRPAETTPGSSRSCPSGSGMEVYVLFTDIPGTLNALRTAVSLASGLSARIRLQFAQVVPYPLPLNRSRVSSQVLARHFTAVSECHKVPTTIDIRLCRDRWDAIRQALRPHSLVVIGSRRRWWPTKEKRTAAHL